MPELEPTWQRSIRVWWLILWRTFVGAVIVGAMFAIVVRIAPPSAGLATYVFIAGLEGALLFLWQGVVVRMALRKRYKEFRIALLPRTGS